MHVSNIQIIILYTYNFYYSVFAPILLLTQTFQVQSAKGAKMAYFLHCPISSFVVVPYKINYNYRTEIAVDIILVPTCLVLIRV